MRIFILTFLLMASLTVSAQLDFTFESTVPSQWTPDDQLSISDFHYKEGAKSLCWTTNGESPLTVTLNKFSASGSASFYLYNIEAKNDTLLVEFMEDAEVRRTARVLLNYTGWRRFERSYIEDYATSSAVKVNKARFTLLLIGKEKGVRKIYFDDAHFNAKTNDGRAFGGHMALDIKQLNQSKIWQTELFANPSDIDTRVTEQEITDFLSLKEKLKRTPTSGPITLLAAARTYVKKLNITRNPDGTVKGNVIDIASEISSPYLASLSANMGYLAASTISSDKKLLSDLIDHIADQGIADGIPYVTPSSDYGNARTIPAQFLNILPSCSDQQRVGLMKLIKWITQYGRVHEPEETRLNSVESDIMYNFTPHFLGYAAYQLTPAEGVREMKAVKRYIERCTEYTPGRSDILKPDGTGFHHSTHYNNYMYSYRTWAANICLFKGTSFRISPEAYQRFKKAVLSVYSMATKGEEKHYFSNSLAGRNPFSAGTDLQFDKSGLAELIVAGGDILGKEVDEELAAAYNYYYHSNEFEVAPQSFDGFYQYNYSPIGIYRKKNWTATLHAPTRQFWGAEIYISQNRFGRYQSHGVLDVMYDGSLAKSGYPTNKTGGGWDWNVIPGTTTVHYTSWQEMMPGKNVTQRFDQFAKTKNFSGALSWKDCGMYATDFDQIDTWGGQCFVPTNLEFKKSMYAFGDMLISMGSNISASGNYADDMITATNLFQNIDSNETGDLIVNGVVIPAEAETKTIDAKNADTWMVSPQGTGYFIPKGNNPLIVKHSTQSTPDQSGNLALINALASKAYINHGIKTSERDYLYVVIPGTNSVDMANLARDLSNDGGSYFKVEAKNENLHALTYKPMGITAYTFFGEMENVNIGHVKTVDSQMLLMEKYSSETKILSLAVCNPSVTFGEGDIAMAMNTGILLSGAWTLDQKIEGVSVITDTDNRTTKINLELLGGADPIYLDLKESTPSSLSSLDVNGGMRVVATGKEVEVFNVNDKLSIYDISGKLVKSVFSNASGISQFSLDAAGYYILKAGVEVAKIVIK